MKSATSGIIIPETITADDGSVHTMSPIESPLSLARRKMTAQMINERVAMIRAGMTPQQVIAFYEAKEKDTKKKGRTSKRNPSQPTILEIPDLNRTGSLEPPPLCPKDSFKTTMQQQPSHFKAFNEHTGPHPMRRRGAIENNINNLPKPSHCTAFEEASQYSDNSRGAKDGVIRTKTLRRLQNSGGPAPPHYLALEMDSQKKKKSSAQLKPSPKQREPSPRNSKNIGEKLNSLRENVEYDRRRRSGADLSGELSAFFAKQKKLSIARQLNHKQSIIPDGIAVTSKEGSPSNPPNDDRKTDMTRTFSFEHRAMGKNLENGSGLIHNDEPQRKSIRELLERRPDRQHSTELESNEKTQKRLSSDQNEPLKKQVDMRRCDNGQKRIERKLSEERYESSKKALSEGRSEPTRKAERWFSDGNVTERVELNKTMEPINKGEAKEPNRNIVNTHANVQTEATGIQRSTYKSKLRRASHSLPKHSTDPLPSARPEQPPLPTPLRPTQEDRRVGRRVEQLPADGFSSSVVQNMSVATKANMTSLYDSFQMNDNFENGSFKSTVGTRQTSATKASFPLR